MKWRVVCDCDHSVEENQENLPSDVKLDSVWDGTDAEFIVEARNAQEAAEKVVNGVDEIYSEQAFFVTRDVRTPSETVCFEFDDEGNARYCEE